MIVKIQRAQFPPDDPAMVYNEDRTFVVHTRLLPAVLELMGDRPRIYAEVLIEAGELVVVDVLPEQPW